MIYWRDSKYETRSSALLLDRDGVINRKIDNGYVLAFEQFELIQEFVRCVEPFAAENIPLIIVSNQSCVGRGLITEDALRQIMKAMIAQLAQRNVTISGYITCPHHPTSNCSCRKPLPGLLLATTALFGVDLHASAFIGDSESDARAGEAAGCQTFLVGSSPDDYEASFRLAYDYISKSSALASL